MTFDYEALEQWQKADHEKRTVSVEFTSFREPKAWLYQVNIGIGIHLKPGDPIPSPQAFIDKKRKQLEEEMSQLPGA